MFTFRRFGALLLAAGVICLPAVATAQIADPAGASPASVEADGGAGDVVETSESAEASEGDVLVDPEGAALLLVYVDGEPTRTVVEIDDDSFEALAQSLASVTSIDAQELDALLDAIGAFDLEAGFAPALGELSLDGTHEISIGNADVEGIELGRFSVVFPNLEPVPGPSPSTAPAPQGSGEATPEGEAPAEAEATESPDGQAADAEGPQMVLVEEIVEEIVDEIVEVASLEVPADTAQAATATNYVNRPLTQRPTVGATPSATASPGATTAAASSEPADGVPTPESVHNAVTLPVTGLSHSEQESAGIAENAAGAKDVEADGTAAQTARESMFVSSPRRAAAVAMGGAAAIGLIAALSIVAIRRVNR